jgi:hypothetical protein
MNYSKTALAAGIGVIIAVGIIIGSSVVTTYPNVNLFFPATNRATQTTPSSQGAGGSSGLGASYPNGGLLYVSMIDPPDAPKNVTHVYIDYSSIQVHDIVFASNKTGWYNVTAKGTIDLMSVVNESKILGGANLPAGTFNIVRFNITSAIVTVSSSSGINKNFTAMVPNGRVQVTIVGGITVKTGQVANLLIDISPKVVQIGQGRFMLVPAATARPAS